MAQELNASMMPFYPYHSGNNPLHTPGSDSQTLVFVKRGSAIQQRKEALISKIITFLCGLDQPAGPPVVLALAPGHKPKSYGFLQEVIQKLAREHLTRFVDGSTQLMRTVEVPKSATTPGPRDIAIHRNSIAVCTPSGVAVESLNTGRVVWILDDIWTSGATLRACGEKISTTGASEIKLIAIGKTM